MSYIKNFKKQWPLTAGEKKWLNRIHKEIFLLQKGLKITYATKNKEYRNQILWKMKTLSEHKKERMQRIWKRRSRAFIGR